MPALHPPRYRDGASPSRCSELITLLIQMPITASVWPPECSFCIYIEIAISEIVCTNAADFSSSGQFARGNDPPRISVNPEQLAVK